MGKLARINRARREAAMAAAGAEGSDESLPPAPEPSPSAELPADKIELLELFDKHARARNRLRAMAGKAGEWAGIPMPLEGEDLVVHPSYAFAGVLTRPKKTEEDLERAGYRIRNVFWSWRWRARIVIFERDGKVMWTPILGTGNSATMELQTLGCSLAWGIEQEGRAVQLLATLLKHVAFKYYLMTGMFLETSKRSGIHYLFRKLRPTVALHAKKGKLSVLAALCMHPIGYYDGSWAGAMCPTDDVIAHLMLMRADEHLFWRRCNQHAAWEPQAGL